MIYFSGDAKAGDVFYTRSKDDGASFRPPLRVNSQAKSVIAIGTVRGAQLAVGRDGRVHVAWMGAADAAPRAPGDSAPMLYARLSGDGDDMRFEPQRNLIQRHPGLDGGGSVAADGRGNVWVAWHAPEEPGLHDEGRRRVYVARSTDDGATFAPEEPASPEGKGCCACCGMRAFATRAGSFYALFRSATDSVHRDMHLIASRGDTGELALEKLQGWKVATCVMSTAALCELPSDGVAAAWETEEQIWFAKLETSTDASEPISAPGVGPRRKHPAIAVDAQGRLILAWTEGTAWQRGGKVAWQVYDARGKPIPGASGKRVGLPVWGRVAAFARRGGGFTVVY